MATAAAPAITKISVAAARMMDDMMVVGKGFEIDALCCALVGSGGESLDYLLIEDWCNVAMVQRASRSGGEFSLVMYLKSGGQTWGSTPHGLP